MRPRMTCEIFFCAIAPVSWCDWIPDRYVLDFAVRDAGDGITPIEADFLTWEPERQFDVATCLQVLEHLDNPVPFCEKLKKIARHLIVSVPYKWLGNAPGHVQDPVDEQKLLGWMQLRPNNSQVVYEPFREGRLIAYYNLESGPAARFDPTSVRLRWKLDGTAAS